MVQLDPAAHAEAGLALYWQAGALRRRDGTRRRELDELHRHDLDELRCHTSQLLLDLARGHVAGPMARAALPAIGTFVDAVEWRDRPRPEWRAFMARAQQRAEDRRTKTRKRMATGHQGVRGRLPSDEHPNLKWVVMGTPRRPKAGPAPDELYAQDKLSALDQDHLLPTEAMRNMVWMQLRGSFHPEDLRRYMRARGLLLPSFVAGDCQGELLRDPTLFYNLRDAVAFTPAARTRPQATWELARAALVAALQAFGADPAQLGRLGFPDPLRPDRRRLIWGGPCTLTENPAMPELPALWPGLQPYLPAGRVLLGWRRVPRMPRCATPEDRRNRLVEAGRKGGEARGAKMRQATQARIRDAIQDLSTDGCQPTQQAIADAIGMSLRTVERHLEAMRTAALEPDTKPVQDIGDPPPCPAAPAAGAVPEIHGPPERTSRTRERRRPVDLGGGWGHPLPPAPGRTRVQASAPRRPNGARRGEPAKPAGGARSPTLHPPGQNQPRPAPDCRLLPLRAGWQAGREEGPVARAAPDRPMALPRSGLAADATLARGDGPALLGTRAHVALGTELGVVHQLGLDRPRPAALAPHPGHQPVRPGLGAMVLGQQLDREAGGPAAGAPHLDPPPGEAGQGVLGQNGARYGASLPGQGQSEATVSEAVIQVLSHRDSSFSERF
jgi:hypothetical protein